jgi:hypothetical protein
MRPAVPFKANQGSGSPQPFCVEGTPSRSASLEPSTVMASPASRASRTSKRCVFLLPLLLCAFLALSASPALAVRGHVFGSAFGWGVLDGGSELQRCTPGTGCMPGVAGSGAGQLKEPEAIAVNETTGNVYIADKGNNRVDEYTQEGVFIAAWGWGVSNGKEEYETCTTACQAGIPGANEGQFLQPRSIAVDNGCDEAKPAVCKTEDPSAEDVYVETGEYNQQVVDKFTPTGHYLGKITGPASGPGAFTGGIEGIAINDTPEKGPSKGQLWALNLPGSPVSEPQGADSFSNQAVNAFTGFVDAAAGRFNGHGLAVDDEDDLYIRYNDEGSVFVAEFSATGQLLDRVVDGLGEVAFNGVAVESSTGDVYVENSVVVGRAGPYAPVSGENQRLERFGEGVLPGSGCRGEVLSCVGGMVVDAVSGGGVCGGWGV